MLDNLVNVIHGIVQKYESVDVSQLRKLGTISIKIAKAQLDIRFLNNCKLYNVIPKFLCFNLPGTNETDSRFIRKRLIRSALKKQVLQKCTNHNVQNSVKNVIKTHEKKLKNLTKIVQLPFTSDEAIKNFSHYNLTEAETSVLKFGLKQPLNPKR